jgi:hypothetical protein
MQYRYAILALGFLGCKPLVRIEISFEVPGIEELDPAKLHVRGRFICNSFERSEPPPAAPTPPPPGLAEAGETAPREVERIATFQRSGEHVRASFSGTRCVVSITAFYDTNGDGLVGAGDYTLALTGFEAKTTPLFTCKGNMNPLGRYELKPVETPPAITR